MMLVVLSQELKAVTFTLLCSFNKPNLATLNNWSKNTGHLVYSQLGQ